jgi:hypothetical protein
MHGVNRLVFRPQRVFVSIILTPSGALKVLPDEQPSIY